MTAPDTARLRRPRVTEELVQIGLQVQADLQDRDSAVEAPREEREEILADVERTETALANAFALVRSILADVGALDARTKLQRLSRLLEEGGGYIESDLTFIEIKVEAWISTFEAGRAALSWADGLPPVCQGAFVDGCWRLVEKGHEVCAACEHRQNHPGLYGRDGGRQA